MDFVSGDKQRQMNRVVMVDMAADGSHRLIGFVTREKFDDLPGGIGSSDQVAVYLPMSYQLGGYTVLMPRDRVHAVDMPIEQAMRFALTAGVHTESQPQ
jgi:uncharacterized membrane protein